MKMAAHRSAEKRVRDRCVEPEKKPELAAHRPEGADLAQGCTEPWRADRQLSHDGQQVSRSSLNGTVRRDLYIRRQTLVVELRFAVRMRVQERRHTYVRPVVQVDLDRSSETSARSLPKNASTTSRLQGHREHLKTPERHAIDRDRDWKLILLLEQEAVPCFDVGRFACSVDLSPEDAARDEPRGGLDETLVSVGPAQIDDPATRAFREQAIHGRLRGQRARGRKVGPGDLTDAAREQRRRELRYCHVSTDLRHVTRRRHATRVGASRSEVVRAAVRRHREHSADCGVPRNFRRQPSRTGDPFGGLREEPEVIHRRVAASSEARGLNVSARCRGSRCAPDTLECRDQQRTRLGRENRLRSHRAENELDLRASDIGGRHWARRLVRRRGANSCEAEPYQGPDETAERMSTQARPPVAPANSIVDDRVAWYCRCFSKESMPAVKRLKAWKTISKSWTLRSAPSSPVARPGR